MGACPTWLNVPPTLMYTAEQFQEVATQGDVDRRALDRVTLELAKAVEERDAAREQAAKVARVDGCCTAEILRLNAEIVAFRKERDRRASELLEVVEERDGAVGEAQMQLELRKKAERRVVEVEAALQEIGEIYSTGPDDDWEPDTANALRKMLRAKVQFARDTLALRPREG